MSQVAAAPVAGREKQKSTKKPLVILAVIAAAVLLPVGCSVSSYNGLVGLDQDVKAEWAQVENVYQRRLDLVPNLVATVKGAAAFEKDTFTAVTEARSRAASVSGANATRPPSDPAELSWCRHVVPSSYSAMQASTRASGKTCGTSLLPSKPITSAGASLRRAWSQALQGPPKTLRCTFPRTLSVRPISA